MAIDSYFSRTILVSSDVRFVLHRTVNGAQAYISMLAPTGIYISTQTPKNNTPLAVATFGEPTVFIKASDCTFLVPADLHVD